MTTIKVGSKIVSYEEVTSPDSRAFRVEVDGQHFVVEVINGQLHSTSLGEKHPDVMQRLAQLVRGK